MFNCEISVIARVTLEVENALGVETGCVAIFVSC